MMRGLKAVWITLCVIALLNTPFLALAISVTPTGIIRDVTTDLFFTCTPGNTIGIYDSSGAASGSAPYNSNCSSSYNGSDFGWNGTDAAYTGTVVENDGSCTSFATLADIRLDPCYVGELAITFSPTMNLTFSPNSIAVADEASTTFNVTGKLDSNLYNVDIFFPDGTNTGYAPNNFTLPDSFTGVSAQFLSAPVGNYTAVVCDLNNDANGKCASSSANLADLTSDVSFVQNLGTVLTITSPSVGAAGAFYVPPAADVIAGIGNYSAPTFQSTFGIVAIIIGITIGIFIVILVISLLKRGTKAVMKTAGAKPRYRYLYSKSSKFKGRAAGYERY